MRVLLVSTYELGRQPFGLASPAAWLRRSGCLVEVQDLAVEPLREEAVRAADLICFHLPMHTATRLATAALARCRELNPAAHYCAYGLYAPLNAPFLRKVGFQTLLGGEFEQGLVALVGRLGETGARAAAGARAEELVQLGKQAFLVPDRTGLPSLSAYAALRLPSGDEAVVGYTEATRGCKHLCAHCPVVPVYQGTLRVVAMEVVLADVAQQIEAGARHITFGDPDFLNAPGHSLRVCREMHRRFPEITFDLTAKVEHLLRHADALAALRDAGCILVTTAAESMNPTTLERLDKGHTPDDFRRAVRLAGELGITLNPTFIPFTPWDGPGDFRDLLRAIVELGLVKHVAPIQYSLRLLLPVGSLLLDREDIRSVIVGFDESGLCHPWRHPDPEMDVLHHRIVSAVGKSSSPAGRLAAFSRIWDIAMAGDSGNARTGLKVAGLDQARQRATVPYLTEPWYC